MPRVRKIVGTHFQRFAWGALFKKRGYYNLERSRHARRVQVGVCGRWVFLRVCCVFSKMFFESLHKKFFMQSKEQSSDIMAQTRSMKVVLEELKTPRVYVQQIEEDEEAEMGSEASSGEMESEDGFDLQDDETKVWL